MPLHFMPNWSNYMKGASPYLRYWVLLDPAVHLINSSFFISVVDLERPSNILPFGGVFHCFLHFFSCQGWEWLSTTVLRILSCLSCNQWPLLLNYGVWIWALWWPSPGDPTTDPSIRVQASCHCFVPCIAISPSSFFFFFHLYDLYEEGNERKRVTRVVFSHLLTSEALNRGSVFTLILGSVHLRFKGWRAGSVTLLLEIISSFVFLVPWHWGWRLKGCLEPRSTIRPHFLIYTAAASFPRGAGWPRVISCSSVLMPNSLSIDPPLDIGYPHKPCLMSGPVQL